MASNPTLKEGTLGERDYADAGMVAVAAPTRGSNRKAKLSEKRMADAILQALAEGIPINSPEIKKRMNEARRR